ncbi:MAG: ABC transporter permease [Myxococcota bacterium]|jgi:putative ABC transport system permease protein|nr:ABC transporter permease [Myxococcota bacterium]
MMFLVHPRHVRRSLVQFRTHPLRTALALLGMVLGVSSVVGMVSIGEGAQREILASIEALGGDVVHIKAKEVPDEKIGELVNDSRGLNRNDIPALRATFTTIGDTAFARWTSIGVNDLPIPTYNVKLAAVEPAVFVVHRLRVSEGRGLTDSDDRFGKRVAVLGSDIARQAFDGHALGKQIRIGYAYFEVVGTLEPKRSGGDLPIDPEAYNRAVVVPFTTATEQLAPADAYREIDVISLRVGSLSETLMAKKAITPVLKSLHGGVEDFEIIAPEEILEKKQATQAILNLVLISIAAISLLVGGIGVMNIMLANIMERISEIGLRRAIGASRRDIRDQFLVESVIVCFIGGVIGIVLGFLVSFLVGWIFGLKVALAWTAMAVSFGLSVAVGLVFGIWPAMRASQVSPVEALQHE